MTKSKTSTKQISGVYNFGLFSVCVWVAVQKPNRDSSRQRPDEELEGTSNSLGSLSL